MTWRALVADDFGMDGVAITLGQDFGEDGTGIVQPIDLTIKREPKYASVAEPSLRLPGEAARALYDALARHYGGTSDVRAVRQDLDVERQRVDVLVEHLAAVARGRANEER